MAKFRINGALFECRQSLGDDIVSGKKISAGDWVLEDENGSISFMHDGEFRSKANPINSDSKKSLNEGLTYLNE